MILGTRIYEDWRISGVNSLIYKQSPLWIGHTYLQIAPGRAGWTVDVEEGGGVVSPEEADRAKQ